MKTMPTGALWTGGYGAAELTRFYPRFMSQSLIISIALQVALIATFDAFREPERVFAKPDRRVSPPPVDQGRIPVHFVGGVPSGGSTGGRHLAGLRFAIPNPVPFVVQDSSAENPWLPSEGDVGIEGGTSNAGSWPGGGSDSGEDITEPTIFTPFERPPEVVKRVDAKYPPLAIRSGVEGTVTVQVFVSKTGAVRKAIVFATTAEILNDAAVRAAQQWVFTPALMNKNPVGVWVSIPFKFRLR